MIKTFFCFALLVFTTAASACKTNFPYSPSIVGRKHSMRRPCAPSKFVANAKVSVEANEIRYIPFYESFNHGGVPGYVCPLTYIFKIQRGKPLLFELPRLVAPQNSGPLNEYCKREHGKKQMILRPVGPTRARFTSAVKATVEGITFLRDHECRPGPNKPHFPFTYKEEYLNPWLDGPITYLYGVSYNFGICLD